MRNFAPNFFVLEINHYNCNYYILVGVVVVGVAFGMVMVIGIVVVVISIFDCVVTPIVVEDYFVVGVRIGIVESY